MTSLSKLFSTLFILTIFSCNQNVTTEKENELLKKENELLKKEQELNNKNKTQQSTNQNKPTTTNTESWKTFSHKYGFSIELPNYFNQGSLTASGIQYYTNNLNEDIRVTVETNGQGLTSSFGKEYQTTINYSNGIKYKILKDNWYVISGQDTEGIYYLKTIVKKGQRHYLNIRYPISLKGIFESFLPRIARSFK